MAIITLNRCPSTLQEGFDKYSPSALKYLTDGKPVSCILPYDVLGSDREAQADYPLAIALIEHSFLSDASKRLYLQTFNYRRSTLR